MPDPDLQHSSRFAHRADQGRSLREHTARGTIVNAGFNVGLASVGAARHFLVAIFLSAADYGLWGLIYVAVIGVLWLKDAGLGDKFIQQDEADQETAFQKAFTLNLAWTVLFSLLIVATMPLFSLLYGRPEIILPGCVLAAGVLGTAFQTPTWIFYREMRFARQRTLQAVDPVVGFVVTMGLGLAGASYWSLVVGVTVGIWASAIASLIACPYPIRLRYEAGTLREYARFSWPVLVAGGSGLVVIQAAVILGEQTAGLAGVGAIGLAGTIAAFADRVDHIVSSTLYPAICAVTDRVDLLFEAFTKSNRLALIWGMPFGIGLALFAPDLVEFVLGEKWDVATGLLQVFGITAAVNQIGFNWPAFQRAVGQTRPLAISGLATLTVFAVVGVPGMLLLDGITGYAVAICAICAAQFTIRTVYLKRMFPGFAMLRHSARAIVPIVPAAGAVLAMRLAEDGRPPGVVVAELALFTVVTLAATWAAERALVREMVGYLRGEPRATPA